MEEILQAIKSLETTIQTGLRDIKIIPMCLAGIIIIIALASTVGRWFAKRKSKGYVGIKKGPHKQNF